LCDVPCRLSLPTLAVDAHGLSPLDYARNYHHTDVAAVLDGAITQWERRQAARLAAAKRGGWLGCLRDVVCCSCGTRGAADGSAVSGGGVGLKRE
jgi:hypothetical protein